MTTHPTPDAAREAVRNAESSETTEEAGHHYDLLMAYIDATSTLAAENAALRAASTGPWNSNTPDEHDEAIIAAHPLNSKTKAAWKAYGVASEMVSNRYSKGSLINLVTWLVMDHAVLQELVDLAIQDIDFDHI